MKAFGNVGIDFSPSGHIVIKVRARNFWFVRGGCRKIAFMGNSEQILAKTEIENNLGGTRDGTDDTQRCRTIHELIMPRLTCSVLVRSKLNWYTGVYDYGCVGSGNVGGEIGRAHV